MAVNVSELVVNIRTDGVAPAVKALGTVEARGKQAAKANTEWAQSLVYSFNGMSASALGVSQSFGTLAANVLPLVGVSTPIIAGLMVGAYAVGKAYSALGGAAKQAAKEASEAAASFKKSLAEMINAGNGIALTQQLSEIEDGTPGASYQDGISGLRNQRALLMRRALAEEARMRRMQTGYAAAQGIGMYAGAPVKSALRDEIEKIDAKLAEAQTKASALYAAIHDPTNARRGPGVTGAPAVRVTESTGGGRGGRGGSGGGGSLLDRLSASSMAEAGRIGIGRTRDLGYDSAADFYGLADDPRDAANSMMKGASAQIAKFREQIVPEWAQQMTALQDSFAQSFAATIGGAIGDGFQRAFASGSITEGFKALGGAMLSGLGGAVRQFGEGALLVSKLMVKLKAAFVSLNPGAQIAAAVGMIALGGALQGMASRAFGGDGGARGSFGATQNLGTSGGAVGAVPQIIDRGLIGTNWGGAYGRAAMGAPVSITVIGPNDPQAQRAIIEAVRMGQARGLSTDPDRVAL